MTYVEHELSPLFFLVSLVALIVFGVMGLILIPIAYLTLKNAIHRCSRCLGHIGTSQYFGLPDF